MFEVPFEYGDVVWDNDFVNRDEERKRLSQNLVSGISTILISPRRLGKSSLVKKIAEENKDKKVVYCFLDMFHINSEFDFYEQFSRAVLRATSSKTEEYLKYIKKFFKKITPKISIGTDPMNTMDVLFEYSNATENYLELVNLAENIAKEKKIRLIVCIDEFQNLEKFDDPESFQRKLRSAWQHHKNVSYCLYGSKKHMMSEIFQHRDMPFYRFGDIMFLEKISTEHWVKFIIKQFKKTKKSISKKLATNIVDLVENHSYYVQQLSHLVWFRTVDKVDESILQVAVEDVLKQNSIFYNREIEFLAYSHINFLRAVIEGETKFHSKDAIAKYKLGTSSNVTKIKRALEDKEIISLENGQVTFLDPVFKLWMEQKYLNRI